MQNEIKKTNKHKVNINFRESIFASDIKKIEYLSPEAVILDTGMGRMSVRGSGIYVESLDSVSNDIIIKGKISGVIYHEKNENNKWLKRIFKWAFMIMTQNEIVLSILAGALIGIIYTFFYIIRLIFRKKFLDFILDFTFTALAFVITFIISLAINYAYLRLMQVLFEFISFWSVLFLTNDIVNYFKDKLFFKRK